MGETKDLGRPLYITFLDATKAFDVIWHASLFTKIARRGIDGNIWCVPTRLHGMLILHHTFPGKVTSPGFSLSYKGYVREEYTPWNNTKLILMTP